MLVCAAQVNIFVTNRFVAVPEVLSSERMLVEQLGVSGFYHVIVRCMTVSCLSPVAPVPRQTVCSLPHALAPHLVALRVSLRSCLTARSSDGCMLFSQGDTGPCRGEYIEFSCSQIPMSCLWSTGPHACKRGLAHSMPAT